MEQAAHIISTIPSITKWTNQYNNPLKELLKAEITRFWQAFTCRGKDNVPTDIIINLYLQVEFKIDEINNHSTDTNEYKAAIQFYESIKTFCFNYLDVVFHEFIPAYVDKTHKDYITNRKDIRKFLQDLARKRSFWKSFRPDHTLNPIIIKLTLSKFIISRKRVNALPNACY